MSKVCIIVPVYNAEKYISKCIESILSQRFTEFTLILVNDGSADRSLDICQQYAVIDKRIVVLSQENKGAASARNHGLDWALSKGNAEYIAFVDGDDWVHSDYLQQLYDGVCSTGCRISMCNALRGDTRDISITIEKCESEISTPEKMWCYDRNLCVVPWGKLYAADLFHTIRFPEEAKAAEDEFVSYQVLFACDQICHITARLYVYYQSENSIMRSAWTPKRMAGMEALELQQDFFNKNGYRDALHESANTYLYLLNDYIKSIDNAGERDKYRAYYKVLKNKLREGIRKYFSEYKFPLSGNEWVYALTHPFIGKILQFKKLSH